jgi:hypothetical protein
MTLENAIRDGLSGVELKLSSSGPNSVSVDKKPRRVLVTQVGTSEFEMSFSAQGTGYGDGTARVFSDVLESIAAFVVDAESLSRMKSRFPWLQPSLSAFIHELGPAAFVAHKWAQLAISVQLFMPAFPTLELLIREAGSRPELHQLYPFTSIHYLCFSRTTAYPFSKDCPRVGPLWENRFEVLSAKGDRISEHTNIVEAVDLVVAVLPPNCGPAIHGTYEDLYGVEP